MPASLESLELRGVRSYSPSIENYQHIEFMPLTLIVGPNGSGKTTIIESLKFIISGEEPPLSDSRRNFVNNSLYLEQPKSKNCQSDRKTNNASIKLKFTDSKNRKCMAIRDITVLEKKGVPTISSSFRIDNRVNHINKQDEWSKTIPPLFNLQNQAILNNVILCHQEDNLWCMGDSNSVKQIFDKIFSCDQYKKEIKHIDAELRTLKTDLEVANRMSDLEEKEFKRLGAISTKLDREKIEESTIKRVVDNLDSSINDRIILLDQLRREMGDLDDRLSKVDILSGKISSLRDRQKRVLLTSGVIDASTNELRQMLSSQEDLIKLKKLSVSEIGKSEVKIKSEIVNLEMACRHSVDLRNKEIELTSRISEYKCGCLALENNIDTSRSYITKIEDQISKANPVADGLFKVDQNLTTMSNITKEMPPSNQSDTLNQLVGDSKGVVRGLLVHVKETSDTDLHSAIQEERKKIVDLKAKLANKLDLVSKVTLELERVSQPSDTSDQKQKLLAEKKLSLEKISSQRLKIFKDLESHRDHQIKLQRSLEFQDIEETIMDLERQVDELSITPDDKKKAISLRDKLSALQMEDMNERNQRSSKQSSLKHIKMRISELEHDLRELPLKSVSLAKTIGKKTCYQMVIEDLSKLKMCFEKSILDFHNKMLNKINETLSSKWSRIYRGSDVECIQLVDEVIAKGKDKSSHNYYVAMRKNGITMKMREKSSAGQKALASIILRMTLAELFAQDFSFMALDEPTSNLDRDNVESLARSIGNYVRRQSEKGTNIQWLIITHDELFLRCLDAESSPFFFKIQLDDRRCSVIQKISFSDSVLGSNPLD